MAWRSPPSAATAQSPRSRFGAQATEADRAGTSRDSRSGRLTVGVLACYLLAAVVVTWRLWADPASRAVAGNPGDADLFAWYMRYAATALAHGRLPALVTTTLNPPSGINLMWNSSMLLPCVVLAPVTLLFGPQVSLTVLTTLGFAGSAAAMFLVLRRWQVSVAAAAIGGAVYGFSPALVQSAIGHYDLQFAVLPPLIIDSFLRLLIRPRDATGLRPEFLAGLRLGLLMSAQLFISEELALTTALAGLLIGCLLAASRPRAAARQAALTACGLIVATGTTLVLAGWALWVQFAGPLTQGGSPFLRDFYVNDLSGFVTPSSFLLFHTSASAVAAASYQGEAPEYLAYVGWPLIIASGVAALVFWRCLAIRTMALTAAILAIFSLGGHPLVSGTTHATVNLPWHWIEMLPLGGSVLPDRLSILVDGAMATLLAVTIDELVRRLAARPRWLRALADRVPPALAGAVAVLACLPLVPLPLPTAPAIALPAGWTAALRALDLPSGATVLVVPVPEVHLTAAMRWEADSRRSFALVGGYFIGPAWNGLGYVDGNGLTPTATYLDELWATGLRPGTALESEALAAGLLQPNAPLPAAPTSSQVRADLITWHPAAIVAVTARGSALAGYLNALFGPPTVRVGSVLAWRR
jgi:hypothetical protein